MKNVWHIGCSGYYYPEWKDLFYPEGLAPKHWLAYYNSVFNTVELNGTFYRVPKAADLKKYAANTSQDFTFSVKVNKYITHTIRLNDAARLIHEFQDLILHGLGEKVAHFLFQMPPTFRYSEENLDRVLGNIPHQPVNVIEFRHGSWWNSNTQKALSEANITFCNVDYPGLKSHFMHTTDRFYLRLHGTPLLFQSPYSTYRLRAFYQRIPAAMSAYYVYFNNTARNAAYKNAAQLVKIVYKHA